MENFRSKSTREGRLQMETYYGGGGGGAATGGPPNMNDLRCYSTSYAYTSSSSSSVPAPAPAYNKEGRMKKSKSRVSSSFASSKSWSFNDPELQRKKRVVGYKAYAMEGKMKGSLRKSFRWIKNTATHVIYGWW